MSQTSPTGDYVLTNFRYLSAYNELVARISQRQQTLTLFVAIFTGLVTAVVATRDVFRTSHSSIAWIMIGFPCASIALTLLNYKYELLLSILREYLADLEAVKDAHLHYPSYNHDPAYMERANNARQFHDLTCAVLILAYNAAAIGLYISICGTTVQPYPLVIWGVALTGLTCFVAHLFLRRVHYHPSKV
jgi:hypothetical protein